MSSAILRPVSAPPRKLARSMSLAWPAGLSIALVLACAGQRGAGRERGNEGATVKADTAVEPGPTTKQPTPTDERPAIDVVALDPGDARPCERMCGRVGDCLQTEEGAEPAEATGVEFACLDTCVYAEPLDSATTAFQSCDEAKACGELLECARGRWDAVAAARRQVEIPTQFVAVRDTCETACLTLQSCNYYYRMPNDLGNLDTPDFHIYVQACTEGCRSSGEQAYQWFADCTTEPNCDSFWACTARPHP
jgi:hypothetical protein